MAQTQDNAIKIVQAALRSDRDFETYKPQIIQKIKASDDVMIKATVDTVKKYLKDKKKEGFSKLTALMLLKECMDTKNSALVDYVHKKILRRLGLIAQGKDKCLPKDTSAALVQLFSQLLRECIVVWNDWFGYDKKKNPTKYKKTYDAVFAKVEKPTKLVHFTKPEPAEDRVLPQSINQSEVRSDIGRSPYQNLEASRPGVSDSAAAQERDRDEDEPPKKKFEIKPQQDPFIEKMTALMKHIKGNKEMLYEQMAISEEPDQQGVKMILQNLIKANQQLADNWDELEAKEFPTKDEIADQAVLDNEVIEELVTEYNKMVKKEITMEDYRVFVIKTLSDPAKNGPDFTPQLSQKPSEISKGQALSPAVNNKSSAATPVQVQAQSESQSQSQQKPQQNDGFDLDAFEEASPELKRQQAEEQARAAKLAQEKAQRERDAVPIRDTGVTGPPDRKAPGQAGSMGGSQASEGGTRKAPRNFRDLFTNDPKDSRGRKAGVGSRRDKSNLDDSKGSVGFGKSWDVNPQGQSQRNRAQQQNKGQQGGFGVDDFDDLPAADPTGSYDDTSNMSADSRTYDFNYDRSRAVDKSRSRLDPRDHQAAAPRFSPSGNVLPPNDEGFNIRGTRKATPSPGYERPSARDIDEALYEAERYDTVVGSGNNQGDNMNRANPPAPAGNRNLTVDTESANRKYDQRTSNMNNVNNNRPSDGNFGFGNPFGGDDNENNYAPQSAGFGPGNSQPNLQINGVPQEANINASRRNTPVSNKNQYQQAPAAQQQQQQQRNQPVAAQNIKAPTVTGQDPRFAPIERPSFLNTLGSTSTINVSTFEGPAMRQADDLLERARRLTSQSRPPSHIDTRPVGMRTSVAGGNYPIPSSLDHQYQPIPPLFSAEPVLRPSMADPIMRRSSLERVGPYASSTFNNAGAAPLVNSAVLNQSSNVGGDGFLREIERAREASKAIAAKYSSPGSRRQSDSGLISNLAVVAALQGTASSNLASAVLQGPTKYTNGGDSSAVLNTSVRIETEMRQSQYSQYGSKPRSPVRKEDDSVTFVGGGAERTSIRDTGRGLATERSEKLSRGYGTAKFPEAGEGKEMTRAAQLIEKARRLREESRQRKTFAGEESEKKEYLYKTPSRLGEASHMKESSYLDNNNNYRREERPMKASQVEVRYVNRMEEQPPAAPQTFYSRYEPNSGFDHIGNTAVNIKSRDVQVSQYASRGRQNETPVRLVGPDGTVYEEVRPGYGIGRKPTPEPRRTAHAGGVRDSPLTTEMVRGRSRETRHETLGQWRHQQQEFGVGMRESRVDLKRSAYHEAKELLENNRRQNEVSAHAERRGRFENISPERLQKTKSPLRERQEKVQEAVELKANETLRIVERPVPGGATTTAGARNISRSPAPREITGRGSVTANSLKASLNVAPSVSNIAAAQGVQQVKTSSSSQLANEIKSQLNALKQSLVGRREKSDSVSSKATLQLDGSSNSVPQIATIQRERERGPIIVQREEVKVQEEGPRKVGVRVDSRDLMGQYSSRVADRELKRSAAVGETVNMRVEKRESETTPAITPYGTDEGFSRRLNVKEISAVQGVKLTMDDSNVWEEESTLRTRGMDESLRRDREREYRDLVGPSYNKPKVGRAVHFDYYLFDQITNAIFANGQGKDVDVFKGACLQNKAVLFDSPKLKIDVITRMEDEEGRTGGKKLKVILHYVNKSNESITGFNVEILENNIVQNPRINGNNLPPKYQLKQELYLDFTNFKNLCYTALITYQHEGFPYSAKVPLPLSVNKFMKLKMVHSGEYKRQWKGLKGGSVKSKYKHINAKFIRDHTEVNKYFDNCLVDVTPTLNPKRKRKYGGVFVLPDGSEHYLRIALDTSRIKFAVASNTNGSQSADWVVQYLSYLLTV